MTLKSNCCGGELQKTPQQSEHCLSLNSVISSVSCKGLALLMVIMVVTVEAAAANAQASSSNTTTTDLESRIQTAAFRQLGLVRQRTGVVFNITIDSSPTGAIFMAVRLRSGSLRRYGISMNEFSIPGGCIAEPYSQRLLLIYARIIDPAFSLLALPPDLALASPLLSLLAYDATNISGGGNAQKLTISVSERPISIDIPRQNGSAAKCADSTGAGLDYTDIVREKCQTDHDGWFALVVNSSSLPPATMTSPSTTPEPLAAQDKEKKKNGDNWKIILGAIAAALAVVLTVVVAALMARRRAGVAEIQRMAYVAEQGEALQISTVKSSRIPTAPDARTKPSRLETDYGGL